MKRIIFCFDGTWNRLDAVHPTNVVKLAHNIEAVGSDGTPQIVHYDEGVGTQKGQRLRGLVFGKGLKKNIEQAYRFLVFNYDPGDDIYIFGYSRGAYTARSFAGMILNSGIVDKQFIGRIPQAINLYYSRKKKSGHLSQALLNFRGECSPSVCVDQKELMWRLDLCRKTKRPETVSETVFNNARSHSPNILRIKYIGVWDTVGALGIPKSLNFANLFKKRYQFHDCKLSHIVTAARHAVAIDEQRITFEPTLWDNLDEMNSRLGYVSSDDSGASQAPYQQKWFPGVHGSVGGGGSYTGLSDGALKWIVDGARAQDLAVKTDKTGNIPGAVPDFTDYLRNQSPPKGLAIGKRLSALMPSRPRKKGRPFALHHISHAAQQRWRSKAETLRPKKIYRPKLTLDLVAMALNWKDQDIYRLHAVIPNKAKSRTRDTMGQDYYLVKKGDTRNTIAQRHLGGKDGALMLETLNAPLLGGGREVSPGQILLIPASIRQSPKPKKPSNPKAKVNTKAELVS